VQGLQLLKGMSTHSKTCACGVLFTTLLLAVSTFAGDRHHALNGTWTLLPERSDFAGQEALQTGTVTINDREGNITVSRDFTYDGANQTVRYSFSIDGQENSTIKNGKTFKTKAKWDRDVLKVTTTQDGATTVERYSMAPDGAMVLEVEQPGQRPLTLVFRRS
jgi:hypothetical protein